MNIGADRKKVAEMEDRIRMLEAQQLALQAQDLNASFDLLEERPQELLEEINRLTAAEGGSEQSTSTRSMALTVADRCVFSSNANSPKKSPVVNWAIVWVSPISSSTMIATRPSWMMYASFPSSS